MAQAVKPEPKPQQTASQAAAPHPAAQQAPAKPVFTDFASI